MLRYVKRNVINVLTCRMSHLFYVLLLVAIFFTGNFILLKRFSEKSSSKKVHVKDILQEKFGQYNNQDSIVEQPITEISNVENNEESFNIRTITKEPLENSEKPSVRSSIQSGIKSSSQVQSNKPHQMVLLVIACNRVSVGRCLDRIFKYKPTDVNIPVIVSQDCGHEPTANVIKSYGDKVIHIMQPDLGNVKGVPPAQMRFQNYYKISRHYKWALNQVFEKYAADSTIIVEDDIDIAPDFFDYFTATRPLLDRDPSLYCVSAWNDNGKEDSVDENAIDLLYRSDFFPGLGWLITKSMWKELGPKWPLGFWDDWMRLPAQRKDRACIRPEISRTKTFGRVGVSQGQFFDQYLKYIKLNDHAYPFPDYDLSHLLRENYDEEFLRKVYSTPEKHVSDVFAGNSDDNEEFARITYHENHEFETIARRLGIMHDLKAGVPRMSYQGVVSIFKNKKRVYIAPPLGAFKGYHEE